MDNENNENISENSSSKEFSVDKNSKQKYKLNEMLKQQLQEHYPEVLELINALQKMVKKQKSKIQKLKEKLKKPKAKTHSVFTQTNSDDSVKVEKTLSEDITEAAEKAVENMGFVYEETSGLYYDYSSGYYYNMELGLYYDGNTGTYMKYNTETQTYDFHSQVALEEKTTTTASEIISKKNQREVKTGKKIKVIASCDLDNLFQSFNQMNIKPLPNVALEIASAWPPCMRIIIKSTELPKLKQGSLHIITFEGGTLGREGNHSLIIPDINISKHHLKFIFNKNASKYEVIDLGSRNGTFLNGKRLSPSKQESEETEITHGSEIQIGCTILLCHIHPGNETCEQCEPGLLLVEETKEKIIPPSKTEQHKNELRQLRKKYGVTWTSENNTQLAKGYTDRAQTRRKTVGSHNENEKTQVASVNESISSENKGFKLLSKMGWSEGQSLGKEGTGVINPIEVVSTIGTTGMGYAGTAPAPTRRINSDKQNIWEKTQKRYQALPSDPTASLEDIFE